MPHGDPAGYLPRVKRARRTKMQAVKGTKIGKVVGKPVMGLKPGSAAPKPRTFQPVTGAAKPRKGYKIRARRSA